MMVPATIAASESGSGPSSLQNLVSPLPPTVDAISAPMVESHGLEIRPNDDREVKKKYVRDDGQTSTANQFAPCGSGPASPQNLVPPKLKKKLQPTVDAMVESHGPEICPYDDRNLKKKYVRDDGQTFAANQFAPCGSGPLSPQNLAAPLQPTVDAMVESHGPEIRPYDDRMLKKKYVQDDGQTFAANQSAPSDGTQYTQPMSQLYYPAVYYQPNFLAYQYDSRISEGIHKIADQQDQLCEKDQIIRELDTDLEKAEDQLCKKDQIISELERKLEKEKAEVCTKDSSLREKEAELATCRRNLDHCETEKRQLQEMFRASQGSIISEKEQLKLELVHCAGWHQQHWMMTIQPLQAELAACTEQFNRLLLVHQRQSAEFERVKRLAQQLQHELAKARETQTHLDESRVPQNDSQDVTQLGQNNGNQQDVNGGGSINTNSGVLPNENTDNATSFVSSGKASTLAAVEVSQMSASSQTDQNLTRSDTKYEHDTFVDGQALHSGNLDVHISPETEPDSVISPSADEEQVLSQENDTNTLLVCWGSTGLTSEIRFVTIEQNSDAKEQENANLTDHGLQGEVANVEEPSFAADASVSV